MLTKYCPEYANVNRRNISDKDLSDFFTRALSEPSNFRIYRISNYLALSEECVHRLYTPKSGTSKYSSLVKAAEQLYKEHEKNGVVEFAC